MLKLIIGSVMVVLLVTAAFAQTVFRRVGPQEANDTGSSIGSPADAINQTWIFNQSPAIDHLTGSNIIVGGDLKGSGGRSDDPILYSDANGKLTEEPKQVCHRVIDNTMVYAVNCAAMASTEYVCPKNGEPCYSFYKIEPAFMGCGRVTKEVCGPPEMFHDEDPRVQVGK